MVWLLFLPHQYTNQLIFQNIFLLLLYFLDGGKPSVFAEGAIRGPVTLNKFCKFLFLGIRKDKVLVPLSKYENFLFFESKITLVGLFAEKILSEFFSALHPKNVKFF